MNLLLENDVGRDQQDTGQPNFLRDEEVLLNRDPMRLPQFVERFRVRVGAVGGIEPGRVFIKSPRFPFGKQRAVFVVAHHFVTVGEVTGGVEGASGKKRGVHQRRDGI